MKALNHRHWLMLTAVLLVVGVAWTWLSRSDPTQVTGRAIPAPRQGFQAPDFSLPDASGQAVHLSKLRGRPVLVNVWASWCGPCRAEMPAMQRLYQDYRSRGFEILAVNATAQDDRQRAMAFIQELELSFPILFDEQNQVSDLYQVQSLPTSFFIDDQGMIQEVVIGGPMSEALLRVRVEQLLEANPKEP